MTEWISVKDKLPKKGLRILFVCEDVKKVLMGHHIRNGLMQFTPSINGLCSKDDDLIITDMLYWMALPELPSE